jgi:hypothetical protein
MPPLAVGRNSASEVSCVQFQSALGRQPWSHAHSQRLHALVPLSPATVVIVRELRHFPFVTRIIQKLGPAESGRCISQYLLGIPLGCNIASTCLLQALDELLPLFEDLLSDIRLNRHHLLRKGPCRLDSCMLYMCHLSLYFN